MTESRRPEFTRSHISHGGPVKPLNLTLDPPYDASAGGTYKVPTALAAYEPTGFNEIDEKTTSVPPVHGGIIEPPLNFRETYGDVNDEF